jgi:hypothetical protein
MLDQQRATTPAERKELEELLNKASALLEGEYVGIPREQGVRSFPVTEDEK